MTTEINQERVPSTAAVLRTRYAMLVVIRFIATVFLLIGFGILATGLLTYAGTQALSALAGGGDLLRMAGPVVAGTLAAALAGASPGLLLLGVQRRLVRWLAPLPPVGCANCGYPASPMFSRCPECGIAWDGARAPGAKAGKPAPPLPPRAAS